MAAYTSLLLVIAFCAATAYSLQCYTCTSASTNSACLTQTTCSSGQTYCQTLVGTVSGVSGSAIIKSCQTSCADGSVSQSGVTATSFCCTTDLCNYNGGASIKSSYAAILLALGSVLMILKSSVL